MALGLEPMGSSLWLQALQAFSRPSFRFSPAIMGYCIFREKLPLRGTVGLMIGFAGIALLLRPGSGLDFFGVAVIVGGQIAWAAGAELSPRVGLPEEPRLAAGLELLSGGAILLAFSVAFGDLGRPSMSPLRPQSRGSAFSGSL